MNKAKIDKLIPYAYDAIRDAGIPDKEGSVSKSFRGQISSFGAAITMGSLLTAIAFFSEKGGADVDRSKLLKAVYGALKADGAISEKSPDLYRWANEQIKSGRELQCREKIVNAAIAVKLAMNLYKLTK